MRKRNLGSSGWQVGEIGLGCMGMSGGYGPSHQDKDESIRVLKRAIDLGVTLIDTADVYGPFTNEELVGEGLSGRRHEVALATKGGLIVEGDRMVRNGHPEHVRKACDASLRRLRTDVIDLYQLHRVDPEIPLEETWGAMASLCEAGKVRYLGLSEVAVEEVERARTLHPVSALQGELSLWSRQHLDGMVPWCGEHGVAFIAFSPLGRGFLTGAFTSAAQLELADWRRGLPRFQSEAIEANQGIVGAVREVGRRHGATPAQVALAWVVAQGAHVVPIPGTKHLPYLEENAAASDLELTADDLAALDRLPEAVGER